MAIIEIEVIGYHDTIHTMTINGKKPKLKKSKNQRIYTADCQGPTAEIIMYKTHNYTGKNWFWWSLLYYFVSIFGIFDSRQDPRCSVIDCRLQIPLNESTTQIKITPNKFQDNTKFIEIESNTNITEISNTQYLDKVGQARHKKMKKIKLGLTLSSAILAILLIVLI